MKRPAARRDRYLLRDLPQEADLFDHKLACLNIHLEFASSSDRETAEERLLAKRAPLGKTARELAALGVGFEDKDLPRSFRASNSKHGSPRQSPAGGGRA